MDGWKHRFQLGLVYVAKQFSSPQMVNRPQRRRCAERRVGRIYHHPMSVRPLDQSNWTLPPFTTARDLFSRCRATILNQVHNSRWSPGSRHYVDVRESVQLQLHPPIKCSPLRSGSVRACSTSFVDIASVLLQNAHSSLKRCPCFTSNVYI
uniref:Uncharacterized protein n=1 Tax=Mesocestoides corti TaxID=53468 RepID=A0A5K3FZ46_MESCO